MTVLTNLAVLLILACISQHVMVVSCQRGKDRKVKTGDKRKEKGQEQRENQQPKLGVQSPKKNDGKTSSRKDVGPFKGEFSSKDTHCTWVATGDDVFILGVRCKKGAKIFDCEYIAKPSVCPQYELDSKLYWKQIARALRKQKKLCHDETSLIKAGMCRKAPKDAHFKLNNTPRINVHSPPIPPAGIKSCPDKVDNSKLAEEHCNGSWSSFCWFFFSMVQGDGC
ncbi:fibroblast growth factor-binding protein 1 [Aplochiton taeniatus]